MNYRNINLPNIIYKKPVNKKSIILYKNENNSDMLSIITPELKILEINNDNIICKLQDNYDINFIEKLKELDQLNISNTYFNSKQWFHKEIPIEVVNSYYKSAITDNKIKFNFKKVDNVLKIEYIIDNNNNYLEINKLKENDSIKMKILYNGILFTKNEFNPIIYIQSIKIDNKQNDNFISDDELSNYSSDDENFEEYFLDNLNKLGNDNLKKLKDNEFQNNNELEDNNYLDNNNDHNQIEQKNDFKENINLKNKYNSKKNNSYLNEDFLKIKNKYNK